MLHLNRNTPSYVILSSVDSAGQTAR